MPGRQQSQKTGDPETPDPVQYPDQYHQYPFNTRSAPVQCHFACTRPYQLGMLWVRGQYSEHRILQRLQREMFSLSSAPRCFCIAVVQHPLLSFVHLCCIPRFNTLLNRRVPHVPCMVCLIALTCRKWNPEILQKRHKNIEKLKNEVTYFPRLSVLTYSWLWVLLAGSKPLTKLHLCLFRCFPDLKNTIQV